VEVLMNARRQPWRRGVCASNLGSWRSSSRSPSRGLTTGFPLSPTRLRDGCSSCPSGSSMPRHAGDSMIAATRDPGYAGTTRCRSGTRTEVGDRARAGRAGPVVREPRAVDEDLHLSAGARTSRPGRRATQCGLSRRALCRPMWLVCVVDPAPVAVADGRRPGGADVVTRSSSPTGSCWCSVRRRSTHSRCATPERTTWFRLSGWLRAPSRRRRQRRGPRRRRAAGC